ncbi:MAG: hypothetical protein K2X91_18965, partial [Thermoleophilia bacterium]|nr:hypothetical protein [Thermoleophilia bacterium]
GGHPGRAKGTRAAPRVVISGILMPTGGRAMHRSTLASPTRTTLSIAAIAAAACVYGCGSPGNTAAGATVVGSDSAELPPLAIHPLTHIDADGASPDGATLVLHLTLDESGAAADPLRSRPLRVELLPADGGAPLRSWDVELGGESGRARYDALVTRTWLVRLVGVPPEIGEWSRSVGGESREGDGPLVRVRWEGESRTVSERLRR